jgi:hypothetical protein
MNNLQITIIVLGALFAICGIVFFAVGKGISGDNVIKILGFEFKLTGSALVIFVLGVVLIITASQMNGADDGKDGNINATASRGSTPAANTNGSSSPAVTLTNQNENINNTTGAAIANPPGKPISEQIREAGELLSTSGDTLSRVNAIGVLEELYKKSGDDYQRITDLLVTFLKLNAGWKGAGSRQATAIPEDINKALRVLARPPRTWKEGDKKIDLSELDLRGANLRFDQKPGANFKGIRLPRAHLDHAQLQYADLEQAILLDASLEGANLFGANLHDAQLDGANIDGADLQQATGACKELVLKQTINYDEKTRMSPCKK